MLALTFGPGGRGLGITMIGLLVGGGPPGPTGADGPGAGGGGISQIPVPGKVHALKPWWKTNPAEQRRWYGHWKYLLQLAGSLK